MGAWVTIAADDYADTEGGGILNWVDADFTVNGSSNELMITTTLTSSMIHQQVSQLLRNSLKVDGAAGNKEVLDDYDCRHRGSYEAWVYLFDFIERFHSPRMTS